MGQVTGERIGVAWVIRLEGSFLTDQDAVLIEEMVARMPVDAECMIVNWLGIQTINSTCLGAVMKGEIDIAKLGRTYKNCAFSVRSQWIVRPFRKSFPWHYFDTEEQAVKACAAE